MIEYIVKFYGINCHNKWIRFLTTGLTISLFSTSILMLNLTKSSTNNTNNLFFILFSLLCNTSKLFNYLLIKYKSTELFELNQKLQKFQNKCLIRQLNIKLFSIFSMFLSVLLAFLMTKIYFCELDASELFEDLNEEMESLPIPSFLQILILNLYHYSWYISNHLLYTEFKTRYISIIKEFKKEVKNEKSETDSDVLKLTQKFVLKFVNFKTDIKKSVDFLKYGISIEFVSNLLMIILFHVNSKCSHFVISFTSLIVVYYLWTMSSNLRIRFIENDLSLNLNRWLHLNPEDSIRIEMDYLEKTVKNLNEKQTIDDKNVI